MRDTREVQNVSEKCQKSGKEMMKILGSPKVVSEADVYRTFLHKYAKGTDKLVKKKKGQKISL